MQLPLGTASVGLLTYRQHHTNVAILLLPQKITASNVLSDTFPRLAKEFDMGNVDSGCILLRP